MNTRNRKIYNSQKNFCTVYQHLHTYLWKPSLLHSVYILTNIYIDKHPSIFTPHWIQKLIPLVADWSFGRTLLEIGNQSQMACTKQTSQGRLVTWDTHLTQAKISSEKPEELEKVKQTHNTSMKRTQKDPTPKKIMTTPTDVSMKKKKRRKEEIQSLLQ